jgi:hypothetical protein
VAQKEVLEAVVAVTKPVNVLIKPVSSLFKVCLALVGLLTLNLQAAVLPVDRADALYHYFEGGGVDIQGPSILVRKSIKDKVSVSANYYVDNVSSASIDVVTTASAYTEERIESSVGIDYLHDKTIMSFNYTQSDENDFSARSAHFNLSQDFFGDLTTLNMGYSQGWDEVGMRGDTSFKKDAARRHLRLGVSQILTKNSLMNLTWETITDQGYLNNPYRSYRYIDVGEELGYGFSTEVYPETRTSDSVAIRGMYYLPYRASLKLEFKYFTDTWGIGANTTEIGYVHPWGDDWIFDFKLRHYKQDKADFYSDLFPSIDSQEFFFARDKEMSTFNSNAIGFGATYQKSLNDSDNFDKFSVSLKLDHILFDFEDFRDASKTDLAAEDQPLYSYDANVIRLLFSVYY